jgi:hypothetical protein
MLLDEALNRIIKALSKKPRDPFTHIREIEKLNNARKLVGAPLIPLEFPTLEEAFKTGWDTAGLHVLFEIKEIIRLAGEERAHTLNRNAAE